MLIHTWIKTLKLFETNSIAIGTKQLLQRKIYVKNIIFLQIGVFESL